MAVHVPENVARLVGRCAVRQGVPPKVAIATALWFFGKLNLREKELLISHYLQYGIALENRSDEDPPEKSMEPDPSPPGTVGEPVDP